MPKIAQRETRWIDRVAGDYDDGSPARFRVANLFDALYKTDDFAERLAHLDCDGECGARGHGNDPDAIPCSCTVSGSDVSRASRAADALAYWIEKIDALSLLRRQDMHLYTAACRVWQMLTDIEPRLDIETANYLGQEMRKATS